MFVDATFVRAHVGMYFGSGEATGAALAATEAISNCADQFLQGLATSCWIDRTVCAGRVEWSIRDDGVGLPFDVEGSAVTQWVTSVHDTPTRDGHTPHVHLGSPFGCGLGALAAVCQRLQITSWRHGQRWNLELHRGIPVAEPAVLERGDGRGTTVQFVLDAQVFPDQHDVEALLRQLALRAVHLLPGWRIGFCGEQFHAPRGVADLLRLQVGRAPVVHHRWEDPDLVVDVAAAFTHGSGAPRWTGWCNTSPTTAGSHLRAAYRAFARAGPRPDVGLIHVMLRDPVFSTPTREHIDIPWVGERVYSGLKARLAPQD